MLAVPTALRHAPATPASVTFGACYQAHAAQVFHWGLRFGSGSRAFAEDLAHDVFVKLLQEFSALENPNDLGGWLYRVTANLALARLKRERSFVKRLVTFGAGVRMEAAAPEDRIEVEEDARQAAAALAALPPKERVVLSMKVLDGKSQREIADTLSISEGYVSKLTQRAWTRLQMRGWEVRDGQT